MAAILLLSWIKFRIEIQMMFTISIFFFFSVFHSQERQRHGHHKHPSVVTVSLPDVNRGLQLHGGRGYGVCAGLQTRRRALARGAHGKGENNGI